MSYHRRTFTAQPTPDEIERLLHHMPTVARLAENDWTKGFARSVIRQSYRKGWTPSLKQLPVMRELVSELFRNASDEGGDIELIE